LDLPIDQVKAAAAKRGPRASVSAEAFGNWNKKEEFKAPFYEKSAQLTESLRSRLNQAFMFSNLNPDELEIVLGAMQKMTFQAGAQVIKEGDDGDNLYVVETGKLKCTKVLEKG
jgi:cAMP-dependent protein kinase regulator